MNPYRSLRLRDVRAGQRFTETDCGVTAAFEALEDARAVADGLRDGWECRDKMIAGRAGTADESGVVTFFESHDAGAYGLRLNATL